MKNKLLVVLGQTSTGKTDVSLDLARKFNGEIVSADSRQVYKYLDIGTGKLPGRFKQVERGDGFWKIDGMKIWLYDVVDPVKRFNLYEYILKVEKIINNIAENGKLPILTGGTGLYIRSLLEGVSEFGVQVNEELRAEFETLDIEEIRNRINKIKPDVLNALNNSELNNKRRLIRLLEKLTTPKNLNPFPGIEKNFDVLKLGLRADRQVLNNRIKNRVLSRINQGMIEEAETLLKKNILNLQRMDELGLEYRYLGKLMTGEIKTRDEFIETLSIKISQFAKRQMTWFKKEKNVVWVDTEDQDFLKQVDSSLVSWYN
jgi:tRNA dimethylallyltransferase